jgi:hypothetical protein
MGAVISALQYITGRVHEWRGTSLAELQFWQRDTAWLATLAFVALAATALALRALIRRRARRNRVAVPALLSGMGRSPLAILRHTPLLLFLAGVPFFVLALADPYTSLTQRRETFPGRRICLMIDASTSMVRWFNAPTLRQASSTSGSTSEAAFFTTVAAAERFVRLRMDGKYRDLMALVEFGDQAYVVTPFTHDYDNILLSLSLIGDFGEFLRFPDQGTVLSKAVEQGTRLFKAFDFLDASGNLLLMFSDGEDSSVIAQGKSVRDVINDAVAAKIPIYFVRVNHERALGSVIPDATWKDAVERTGGRFYAAANEGTILQAIRDIDRVSAGRIDVNHYVTQRPWFGPFALAAAALWTLAAALKLTVPMFRTFP